MSDCDDYGYLSNNKIEKVKTSSSNKSKTTNKVRDTSSPNSGSARKSPSTTSSIVVDSIQDKDDDNNWMQF